MHKFLETIHWKKDMNRALMATRVLALCILATTIFMPLDHATWMGFTANLLWMWRD